MRQEVARQSRERREPLEFPQNDQAPTRKNLLT